MTHARPTARYRAVAVRASMVVALAAFAPPSPAVPPRAAHGVFLSHTYAFSFRAPPGLTYCRIPDEWTGSDHGTILFLTPPVACDGTGFPSSSRGFYPEATPRIEIYYGNREPEDGPDPRCRRVGRVRFMGRTHPLCQTRSRGTVEVSVRARYTADSQAEAIATLATTPARLAADLAVLRALAATAHTCTVPWQDAQGHTRFTGSGRPCPASGDFY